MTDGPHIVVVDDDTSILTLLSTSLKAGLGARVTAFASGEETLAGWDALGPVSLVLTDYSMPGMNGVELAAQLRARAPGVPIVMLSALEQRGVSTEGVVAAWLTKPCPPRRLLPELRRLLGLPEGPMIPPSPVPFPPPSAPPAPAVDKARFGEHLKAVLERLGSLVANAGCEAGERALRDELHQLAGTAGSHGFRGITEASLTLRGAIIARGPKEEPVAALRRAIEEALGPLGS